MQPPIADPNETPQRHFEGDDASVFRFKFWPYFGAMFLVSHLTGIIGVAILSQTAPGTPKLFGQIMTTMLWADTAVAALISALFYWMMPLKAGNWGLRAFTYWSGAREVEWTQIKAARLTWNVFPYVIVTTTDGKKLWIVLPLENPRGFARVVVANTAPDHALHHFVTTRGWLG